jgi:polyvinyl alcohol dehydrogenase (cytochrome)
MRTLFVSIVLSAGALYAAPPDAAGLYAKNCSSCHDSGGPRIPNRDALKLLSPESIVRALTSGAMRFQGSYLSGTERGVLAEYLTGKTIEPPKPLAGRCLGDTPQAKLSGNWNGWGIDLENSRSQPAAAAGLGADQVPKLKLKWALGFPGDFVAFAQPAVFNGRLFVGSAGGTVYALDASAGCIFWAYDAGAGVRSAITIGPGETAYFGDLQANVHAVNAVTGRPIWKARVGDFAVARITGSPKLHDGRLYVPVSSHEEWAAGDPRYECCKFRGSVVALDAKTGKRIWKTYTIADEPKPTKKNKVGAQMWGPSGAGVWMSPTIDVKRKLVYVGTGDSYSDPAAATTDSILALDLGTGRIVWSKQITEGDAFNTNCFQPGQVNCPDKMGPDFDFGASPILRSLASGRRVLLCGQKSGVVHALDPDKDGEIVWQTRVGMGGVLGGIQWGSSADHDTMYVALSDLAVQITDPAKIARSEGFQPDPKKGGGLFAIQTATGEKLWTAPPVTGCKIPGCSPSQSAAVTTIPGVVFSGALDGHLRAYSTKDGNILWDYDTIRDYETVNKVQAKGGSIDGPGPVVAGGMLFVNSGYRYFNAIPGNVLLAFGVEGK